MQRLSRFTSFESSSKITQGGHRKVAQENALRVQELYHPTQRYGKRCSHKGVTLRSLLEKSFAQLLDEHQIEWDYEPKRYSVDGRSYLPDFWIPEIQVMVEVKPKYLHERCRGLVNTMKEIHGITVVLLDKDQFQEFVEDVSRRRKDTHK